MVGEREVRGRANENEIKDLQNLNSESLIKPLQGLNFLL